MHNKLLIYNRIGILPLFTIEKNVSPLETLNSSQILRKMDSLVSTTLSGDHVPSVVQICFLSEFLKE